MEHGRTRNHEILKDGPKMITEILLLTERYSLQDSKAIYE